MSGQLQFFLHILPYQGWRPDGVDMSSRRMQLSSHICICKGKPNSSQTLTGILKVLPRRPDGCTITLESSRTLKSIRTCCHDVRTDATFNCSKLLDTDGVWTVLQRRPDGCCWLMSFWTLYWAVRMETKDPTFLSWNPYIIFLEFWK